MKIGVLALQGAFAEHVAALKKLPGAEAVEIRRRDDFPPDLDGLVIPGGESTVMAKLLTDLHLLRPVTDAIGDGLPVFGTCAGLILLAKEIQGTGNGGGLDVLDARVQRNAYGRQLGSYSTTARFSGVGDVPMVFIRAPIVASAGKGVDVLSVVDGKIVAVRERNILATAFHPELTDNTLVHEYFLGMR